jgi:hypothetical protein
MQQNMAFIVNQQAQFASDIQKLGEVQLQFDVRMTRIEGAIVTIIDLLGKVAEAQQRTDARLADLAAGVTEVAVAQKRTEAALTETNERLNSLIVVVERYFSNGRGGQAPG